MTDTIKRKILEQIEQTQHAFLGIINQAYENNLYQAMDDDGWTLAEVLIHMVEARTFFAGEINRIVTEGARTVGRTLDNERRLQTIEDHGRDSQTQIQQNLIASYQTVQDAINLIPGEQWDIEVTHVASGAQSLEKFVRTYIVGHDRIHVEQATAWQS